MNKTNYIILTLILCFSIAFVAHPLKSFAYDLDNGSDGETTTVTDASSVVDTSDLQNAFSQFQEEYTEPEHSNIYTDTEVIPEDVEIDWGEPSSGVYPVEGPLYIGTVVEQEDQEEEDQEEEEEEKEKFYYNTCNRSGWPWNWTWRCVRALHYNDGVDQCQVDSDCGNGETTSDTTDDTTEPTTELTTTTIKTYSGWKCLKTGWGCNTSNEFCKRCTYSSSWNSTSRLYSSKASCQAKCQYKCKCEAYVEPLPESPRYDCDVSTYMCYVNLSGLYKSPFECGIICRSQGLFGTFFGTLLGTPRYDCNRSTYQCEETPTGFYLSHNQCESYCKEPPLRYSCNTSTWGCDVDPNGVYASLSSCQSDCTNKCICKKCPSSGPCVKECKINSDCNITPITTTTTEPITTTTTPPTPKCQIFEFSINGKTNEDRDPLLVWVKASLKGRISTNTDCIKCTVESTDTWGNPNPVEYAMTFANNYNIYETFEIPESGIYSFTVTCQGSDPDDIVVDNFSLETVEAINLPWWREIIPVLPEE